MRDYKIGGHDVSAILGVNPYKTPLHLWAEKTGIIQPKDISDVPAVRRGVELEPLLLRLFAKVTGYSTHPNPNPKDEKGIPRVSHPDNPHFVSAPDGYYSVNDPSVRGVFPLDCKSVGIWSSDKWGEIDPENSRLSSIPLPENIQLQWYMWIEDLPSCAFSVGFVDDSHYRRIDEETFLGLNGWGWTTLSRNDDFCQVMVSRVEEFCRRIETNTQPDDLSPQDRDLVPHVLGHEEPGLTVDLDGNDLALVRQYHSLQTEAERVKRDMDQVHVELQARMGKAEVGLLPTGNKLTFRTQASREVKPKPYVIPEKRVLRLPQRRHMVEP